MTLTIPPMFAPTLFCVHLAILLEANLAQKNVQEQNNLSCAQTRHLHNKFRGEWKGKSIALEMIKVILLGFSLIN